MTLSPIHWVPVKDKGSKILCGKLGAVKITPSDWLHQEYLTINLVTEDSCSCHLWGSVRDRAERGRCWATRAAWGRGRDPGSLTHSLSLLLPIQVSDTAATSQDGCIFRMQGSEGCASNAYSSTDTIGEGVKQFFLVSGGSKL